MARASSSGFEVNDLVLLGAVAGVGYLLYKTIGSGVSQASTGLGEGIGMIGQQAGLTAQDIQNLIAQTTQSSGSLIRETFRDTSTILGGTTQVASTALSGTDKIVGTTTAGANTILSNVGIFGAGISGAIADLGTNFREAATGLTVSAPAAAGTLSYNAAKTVVQAVKAVPQQVSVSLTNAAKPALNAVVGISKAPATTMLGGIEKNIATGISNLFSGIKAIVGGKR